jgi:hypothetical protein
MFKIPRRCLPLPEKSLEHFLPQQKPPWLLRRTTKKKMSPSLNYLNCTHLR